MDSRLLSKVKDAVEKKPIVILRFDEGEWARLKESRLGIVEFTFARSHELLIGVKSPTVCLLHGSASAREEWRIGLLSSRNSITTLDTRIKIRHAVEIEPQTTEELRKLAAIKPYDKLFKDRLEKSDSVILLTPKLSSYLVEQLESIFSNRKALQEIANLLLADRERPDAVLLQEDALHMALKAFGIVTEPRARSLTLKKPKESGLQRVTINEDSVVEHDARQIPDFRLVESHVTGRAVFERGSERLDVFTANKRPLEQVFGVDLIYLNACQQNIVMVQYKMLEFSLIDETESDWIYRPDSKFESEIQRMRRFSARHTPGEDEFRLSASVYFIKFVMRDAGIRNSGIILPIEHYDVLARNGITRGPRGGLRISYRGLAGRYLRETPFLDLIRSGYIGAYAKSTKLLMTLVEATLRNNRAVLAAIQQPLHASAD